MGGMVESYLERRDWKLSVDGTQPRGSITGPPRARFRDRASGCGQVPGTFVAKQRALDL